MSSTKRPELRSVETDQATSPPDEETAREAVRTLLRWAGDDPSREGLIDTPERVVRAFGEWYAGYNENPVEILSKTFEEVEGYDEMVVLKNIGFTSHCEHHMAPILGRAHIGYLPASRVVGISKLARVVEVYARRLQIQEKMTAQIAVAVNDTLNPLGVGVVIEASHGCMTTRGVNKSASSLITSQMIGAFRDNPSTRREFLTAIGNPASGGNFGA